MSNENKIKSFEDLIVWQKAHAMVLKIYSQTKNFPKEELFGITSQIRRAAVSVPNNIVEGYKRTGKQDTLRFLNIAQASLEEVRYLIILSFDLNLLDNKDILEDANEVGRILSGFYKSIKNN